MTIAKHRLEALSDGIFAVVMTLLVIDLKVPSGIAHGQLAAALQAERLPVFAFVVTFGIAARYWTLQHQVFQIAEEFHTNAVMLTMAFLCLLTMLPYTTGLVSRYGGEPLAYRIYCANQALIGACLLGKLAVIRAGNKHALTPELRGISNRILSLTAAMTAGVVSSLVLPQRISYFAPALVMFAMRRFLPRR